MPSKAELIVKSNFHQRKMIRYYYVLDADRDGHIEEEDYLGCAKRLAQLRQLSQGSPGYQAVFDLFRTDWNELQQYADKDRSGEVDMDEWLGYREDIYLGFGPDGDVLEDPEAEKERAGSHLFAMLDSDGDGRVNLDDLTKFYQAYRLPEDLAEKMFAKLDVAGQGHLSQNDVTERFHEFTHSDDPEAAGNWFFGPF